MNSKSRVDIEDIEEGWANLKKRFKKVDYYPDCECYWCPKQRAWMEEKEDLYQRLSEKEGFI